jgi:hypothetical protein
MIALLFAVGTVVLFVGRHELAEVLSGLLTRFTGGAK